MFPVKNCCFHWLLSGKTCNTIFCQVPNIFIGQHKYTLHAILYCVTHIWNRDLAKIGAIHQLVWDVPYVTKWIASSSPCFSWNMMPGVNLLCFLSSLSGLRTCHWNYTVRIKAQTENQKVWIEYQQQIYVQYILSIHPSIF